MISFLPNLITTWNLDLVGTGVGRGQEARQFWRLKLQKIGMLQVLVKCLLNELEGTGREKNMIEYLGGGVDKMKKIVKSGDLLS